MDDLRQSIGVVADFPQRGVLFRDITPMLQDGAAWTRVVDDWATRYQGAAIQKIAGIESRGFVFAAALAYRLGCGLVLLRKAGKLPRETLSVTYELEYGSAQLEMHRDAVAAGERLVVVDDVLATGGTAGAAVELLQRGGACVHEVAVVLELAALRGRKRLAGVAVHAALTY